MAQTMSSKTFAAVTTAAVTTVAAEAAEVATTTDTTTTTTVSSVTTTTKSALRKKYMRVRDALTCEYRAQASEYIAQQLYATAEYAQAEIIFTYVSFKSEVDTHAIIKHAIAQGKRVAVPRCVPRTREMRWHEIRSLGELLTGSYGILEPADDPQTLVDLRDFGTPATNFDMPATKVRQENYVSDPVLALVPAIAFDSLGHRIGYGGGYYDTFLARFSGVSAGLCFRECHLERIAGTESHDVPVDMVLRN